MRKNIDDRFRIKEVEPTEGKRRFEIESMVRDMVDEDFLLEIHTQMSRNRMSLEGQLESIPKQMENLKMQSDKYIPEQLKSFDKKIDTIKTFVKEILAKREEEKKKQEEAAKEPIKSQ